MRLELDAWEAMHMSRKFGTLAAGLSVAAAMTLPSAAQAQGGSLLAEPFVNRDAKAFAPVGKNFEHWLTSARCPTQMGDMPLIRISQYYIQGHSVNCRYVLEGNSKIDFNVRTFDKDENLTSAMKGLVGRFEQGSKVAKVGETQQVRMDFGGRDIACLKTELTMKPLANGTGISEVLTICNGLRWVFQIVEGGHSSDNAKRAQITNALMAGQNNAAAHLGACVEMTKARNAMEPSSATGLNIAVDRFGYEQKGAPCFSGNIGARDGRDALLILSWPQNPDTPISIHKVSSAGDIAKTPQFRLQDMWAGVATEDRGEGGYLMIKEDPDGTLSSYGGFLKIVASGRVYGEYVKVLDGELKPQTVSKPAPGGGNQITIG
jgi:hypothetical protein